MNTNVRVLVATVAVSVLIAGHFSNRSVTTSPIVLAAPSLTDLKGVDELKTLFNGDAGKVRLVLLVSPT